MISEYKIGFLTLLTILFKSTTKPYGYDCLPGYFYIGTINICNGKEKKTIFQNAYSADFE